MSYSYCRPDVVRPATRLGYGASAIWTTDFRSSGDAVGALDAGKAALGVWPLFRNRERSWDHRRRSRPLYSRPQWAQRRRDSRSGGVIRCQCPRQGPVGEAGHRDRTRRRRGARSPNGGSPHLCRRDANGDASTAVLGRRCTGDGLGRAVAELRQGEVAIE